MEYTEADIRMFFRLMDEFPYFLEQVGLDPENAAVAALLSEDRYLVFEATDRQYVEAWVTWKLIFNPDHTALWAHAKARQTAQVRERVAALLKALGPLMSPHLTTDNSILTGFDNGSRLYYGKVSCHVTRGLSLHYLICDAVSPDKKVYAEFRDSALPTMCTIPYAKFITILP